MTTLHFSGFPRVGAFRELKFAQEKYWRKEISEQELLAVAKDLREKNWKHQAAANADYVAVGDFTFYDHILDLQVATGAIPARFGFDSQNLSLEQFFQLARGNKDQFAIEMTNGSTPTTTTWCLNSTPIPNSKPTPNTTFNNCKKPKLWA